MRALKITEVFVGLFLIGLSFYITGRERVIPEHQPVISEQIEARSTVTPEIYPTQTLEVVNLPTEIPPTITPTMEPVFVKEYLLGDMVNLSSGSTALVIQLDESRQLAGNWAEAISRNDVDDQNVVFDPHAGTIYSILGDTTVIAAHSGILYGKPRLFASNLDLYLRTEDTSLIELDAGQAKTFDLIGKSAFLCQTGSGEKAIFLSYDTSAECPGNKLNLRIIAVSLIPREKVSDYDRHLGNLLYWLQKNESNDSFYFLSPRTGFLMITCVGRYPDQPVIEGVPDYDYNRLVLGFEIVR